MKQLSMILLFLLMGLQARGEDVKNPSSTSDGEKSNAVAPVATIEKSKTTVSPTSLTVAEELEIENPETEEPDTTAAPPIPSVVVTSPTSMETQTNREGFFSLYFTREFTPAKQLEFYGSDLTLGFGKQLFHRDYLELNVKFGSPNPFLAVKYEKDFTRDYEWIPGFDASLLFGILTDDNTFVKSFESLAMGLRLGLFVKVFISKSYAILARGGVNYSVPVNSYIYNPDYLNVYMSIGLRKYLKF